MNFEAIIGLEIHVEMKTKSKMFSSAPVIFGDTPNTHVAPLDIAFPGALPVVNKQAVINAIRLCHALHMEIDNTLVFDRKNYFYSDLPKGYQITQNNRPIGKNGYLVIETSNGKKRIDILRLHLEEDTCKQLHDSNYTYLDYNRSGIPLVEIVTQPNIKSGEEAMKFVEKIRAIVSFLDVSDGKMENGSLRCDVNVSLRPIGCKSLNNKVEIKNLNTLSNIQKGIDFEILRQQNLLLTGQSVIKETRRFDERKKETIRMRLKEESVDYKFFTEPNIPPIVLKDEFINEAIQSSNELPDDKMLRYLSLGLNEYDARQLISNKDHCDFFDEVISYDVNPKLASNWITIEIVTVLKKEGISINDFSIKPKKLAELIRLVDNGIISNKQARDIFAKLLIDDIDLNQFIDSLQNSSVDEKSLSTIVKELVDENPQAVVDFKNGKTRIVSFLVGKLMSNLDSRVNPSLINRLVQEELDRR